MSPRNARVEIMRCNVEYFYNDFTDELGPNDFMRASIIPKDIKSKYTVCDIRWYQMTRPRDSTEYNLV